ncbi:uncharacterized protein LOC112056937 isoform X2 [Bicyclus anynana]|uniref:alpha-glucosidase n=1 Tax=Bicyclus anynana TaxID=110368 RepID=A0ABM3LYB3_BICAN|nr:uncharacterized protein LOC112056937 isoform X2 [Bicyclus anynana]
MSETRKNHLTIDGGQVREDDHVASYKPIPETDTEFRTSKASLHKSKEKVSPDGAEEKLLQKEDEAKIVTRVDMVDAKYAVGDHRNGDAKIELDANKKFSGLTKEELMKYAEDPFWVRLRWFMFALFWALWLCMLAGAIIIIVQAPKCAAPPPRTWYEKGPLVEMSQSEDYQQADLELLQKAKVSGIFAYTCENAYDVLNKEEPPTCLKQFKEFALKAKKYGIQIIVDLTANFVPKTHTWFQQSENKTGNFTDYFIWASSEEFNSEGQRLYPNNWVSRENAPAWSLSDKRQQFYLHQVSSDTPDLNFNNIKVVKQFDDVIATWMKAGAGGIRLQHARSLLVDRSFPEDVQLTGQGSTPGAVHTQYAYWTHRGLRDQPALAGLLAHWAQLADTHAVVTEGTVFTIADDSRPELYQKMANVTLRPPSAAPVSLQDATQAAAVINDRLKNNWPMLKLTVNSESAMDEELAAFTLLLPAAPVLQMQQIVSKDNNSVISDLVSHVAELRADISIQHGQLQLKSVSAANSTDSVVAAARWKRGHMGYVSVYNAGAEAARADLTALSWLPEQATVYRAPPSNTNYTTDSSVDCNDVWVPAKSSVVLAYVPKTGADE